MTLTGPGGVGKTRLALEVAHGLAGDGATVHFISVATLRDARLLVTEIAHQVGLVAASPHELIAKLRATEVTLVLDNFEQVTEAAPTVAQILATSPMVSVLATSRVPLRIRGEVEYPVPPLALPARGCNEAPLLVAAPAAALFVSRVCAVRADFILTPSNARAVAEICHRLAGLPLALELAAAATRTLDPVRLLGHLDDVLEDPGPADLPARQQTLRATLDWSYGLLSPEDRSAFRRLSVCAGGFTLELANEVLGMVEGRRRVDHLALHSLCAAMPTTEPPRYAMLEPVSQYGRSLLSSEEGRDVHAALAQYCLRVAESAMPGYHGTEQLSQLERLEDENTNLVTAFEWTVAEADGESAGRLAWALWMYWWIRAQTDWARPLLAKALDLSMSDATRARALVAYGGIAQPGRSPASVERNYQEALRLARRCGDREVEASAALALGTIGLEAERADEAETQLSRAITAAQRAGPKGDWYAGHAQVLLSAARRVTGDLQGAVNSATEGLARARSRSDRVAATIALYNLGQAHLALGDKSAARRHLSNAAVLCGETKDAVNLSMVLQALAATEGSYERAARLLGAAEAVRREFGSEGYRFYQADAQLARRTAQAASEALGSSAYQHAFHAGNRLSLHEAARLAAGNASPRGSQLGDSEL